jgi:hypothetical protein
MQPLTMHGATFASVNAYTTIANPTFSLVGATQPGVPNTVLLHSFVARDAWYPDIAEKEAEQISAIDTAAAPLLGVRFQQLAYGPPTSFNVSTWLDPAYAVVVGTQVGILL